MTSQKPAASPGHHLRLTSPVVVDNQPTGISITIELDPTSQHLDSPLETRQYHKILAVITNILATHLAIAESSPEGQTKINQHLHLANLLFASFGLYPASDGQPDLEMRPARPLFPVQQLYRLINDQT